MIKSLMRGEVPRVMRETVESASREAAHKLHISPPALRWVSAPNDMACAWVNMHDDRTVVCNVPAMARLSHGQIRGLFAHEVYHCYQYQSGRWNFDRRKDEDAADGFAYRMTGELL